MKRYKRLYTEEDTNNEVDIVIDKAITKALKALRDESYGSEEQRKKMLDIFSTLLTSKDPRARKAFKAVGNMFTDIGNELIKYGLDKEV